MVFLCQVDLKVNGQNTPRSPFEPMNVQLQTLQMHNKIIYMISCQSKGLWLKTGFDCGPVLFVRCCFYRVRKPLCTMIRGSNVVLTCEVRFRHFICCIGPGFSFND